MSRKQPNQNVFRYYDHDDRFGSDHNLRRVQHGQGRIKKGKERVWEALRKRVEWDGDEEMNGKQRGNHNRDRNLGPADRIFGNRKNRPIRGGRAIVNNVLRRGQWFQIKICFGSRYDRDDLLARIADYIKPRKFTPICYQVMGQDSVFYEEGFEMAQLLLSCTRKIQLNDGQLMVIRIKDLRPPLSPMDDLLRGRIKNAMGKRYIAENKALDLSSFMRDPEFLDGIFCCLNRPAVLSEVFKMITENISDLVAIDLSDNSIFEFDAITEEIPKLKSLRILHLGRNKDNVEMTPIVAFDVEDEDGKLPPAQAAFICNAEGRGFVKAFLSQYFQIYDSDNRRDLAQAYAENAVFSLTSHAHPNAPSNAPRLNSYTSNSRNLLRVYDFPRRKQRLACGKSDVVKVLDDLPKSQHDLLSFAVDLPFFSPELISLNVTGLFRERGAGSPVNWPLRFFARTYLIVPSGSGFCIVNEVLNVTNATEEQVKVAFKVEPEKPVAAPTPAPAPTIPPVLDDTVKLQMVQAVAQQTGMNIEWSKKCLEETDWDFQRAGWTFTELQKRNAIPPEAFIK